MTAAPQIRLRGELAVGRGRRRSVLAAALLQRSLHLRADRLRVLSIVALGDLDPDGHGASKPSVSGHIDYRPIWSTGLPVNASTGARDSVPGTASAAGMIGAFALNQQGTTLRTIRVELRY